jgi:hypothetical protein
MQVKYCCLMYHFLYDLSHCVVPGCCNSHLIDTGEEGQYIDATLFESNAELDAFGPARFINSTKGTHMESNVCFEGVGGLTQDGLGVPIIATEDIQFGQEILANYEFDLVNRHAPLRSVEVV